MPPPKECGAEHPVRVEPLSVSVPFPRCSRHPPTYAVLPPVSVNPANSTCNGSGENRAPRMDATRSPMAEASMNVVSAAAPITVAWSVISRSPTESPRPTDFLRPASAHRRPPELRSCHARVARWPPSSRLEAYIRRRPFRHTPSPGRTSGASTVLLTPNVAAIDDDAHNTPRNSRPLRKQRMSILLHSCRTFLNRAPGAIA